jgi:threonine/homoserine/homoserine lactone efflux protein
MAMVSFRGERRYSHRSCRPAITGAGIGEALIVGDRPDSLLDTTTLLLFVTASVLLIVAPGPDIVFLVSQGVTRGQRAGFVTAMGLAAGNLVHTLAAALGVSVIFQTSAIAFNALKYAGAAYLLYLAWKAVRASGGAAEAPQAGQAPDESLFWRAVLMNVLNPKVALFFLAFLPQFASSSPGAGPVWMQMIAYGLLFTALVVIVFGAFGLFAGRASRWLKRAAGGRGAGALKWGVAAVFVLLALRLATAER